MQQAARKKSLGPVLKNTEVIFTDECVLRREWESGADHLDFTGVGHCNNIYSFIHLSIHWVIHASKT